MRLLLALVLAPALGAAAPPTTCPLPGDYEAALCAYQKRDFAAATSGFQALADKEPADATNVRARYFLARSMMKTGRFDEASAELIKIYALDPRFYDTWNCDFLLGECRKALGR